MVSLSVSLSIFIPLPASMVLGFAHFCVFGLGVRAFWVRICGPFCLLGFGCGSSVRGFSFGAFIFRFFFVNSRFDLILAWLDLVL